MVLDFKCVLNVQRDVLSPIIEKNGEQGEVDLGLRLVGHEQDGTFICTWQGKPPNANQQDECVTHVGIYDPNTKVNKVLFVHDKLEQIVNATVNQEHTFLGYVSVEQKLCSDSFGKKQMQDIYKAYLVEIHPQNRVFYLNLERQHYLQLQFLYGQYKGTLSTRESHLLVLLHKESIGLYHLPVARIGDKGVLMSGEPKKEQIFAKRFIWAQWTSLHQRLHVVHLRRQGKNTAGQTIYKPFLTTYQFNSSTINEFMLEVALDLPIPQTKSSARSSYLNLGPCCKTPDAAVNLEVLSQPNGTYVICYQHPMSTQLPTTRPGKVEDENHLVNIQYSVCLVHHGKIFNCLGPKIPLKYASKLRIHFTWMNDYLLAYLPGCFTHVLNISAEFEPSHHILCQDPGFPSSLEEKTDPGAGHFITYIRDRSLVASGMGLGSYNCQLEEGYRIGVDRVALEELFQETVSLTTRCAILHYAVAHAKDLGLVRHLLASVVTEPVPTTDLTALLQEYLSVSVYTSLRKQLDRSLMKYFPFTTLETFRGHVEKTSEGVRECSFSYSSMSQVTQGDQHRKWQPDEVWDSLARSRQMIHAARFHCSDVRKELDRCGSQHQEASQSASLQMQSPAERPPSPTDSVKSQGSILRRLSIKAKSTFSKRRSMEIPASEPEAPVTRPVSRSEQVLGPLPPFLCGQDEKPDQAQELVMNKTKELLCNHLCKHLKKENKQKIQNVAAEFVQCQIQQSRTLCHLLWSILVPEGVQVANDMSVTGSEEEYHIFQVLERFYLALHQMGFPLPQGFSFYFTSLAFRVLQLRVFLQYMDQGILEISSEFVKQVLLEVDDSDSSVSAKYQLLQRLPLADALTILPCWDHPDSRLMMARHYTAACLSDELDEVWSLGPSDSAMQTSAKTSAMSPGSSRSLASSVAGISFPPLTTLINQLQTRDSSFASGERVIGTSIVQSSGLQHFTATD